MGTKLKEGRFKAVAKEGSETWGEAGSGNPQVGFIVKIDQRPQGLYDQAVYLPMTEKAEDFSIERLRLCGVQGVIGPGVLMKGLGANKFDVDVAYEMFEGKEQLRIEIVVPREEVRMDRKLSDAKTKALAARLLAKTANGAGPAADDHDAAEPPPV